MNKFSDAADVNIFVAPETFVFGEQESPLVFEKQHAVEGTFRANDQSPEFTFDAEALKHIAVETNRFIANGNICALPVRHTDDSEASRGVNTGFYTREDSKGKLGLFSRVEFRDSEAAKMAKTCSTSIFCPRDFKDGSQIKYVRPVTHVALTTKPVLSGLDGFKAIAASLVSDDGKTSRKENPMLPLKSLAENFDLKLSSEATDEDICKGIADHFKTVGASQEAVTLELSQSKEAFASYKKSNPPKEDPVKVSTAQVDMLLENRELKLDMLVNEGCITPVVKQQLHDMFCGTETLTLCLSGQADDNFKQVHLALSHNDSIKLTEATGPQTEDVAILQLSGEENPLLDDADKKAKAWHEARA